MILFREWKHVEFRTTFVLTGCGLAAVPVGVWFLRFGNELVIQSILSVVVMAFSGWSLFRPERLCLKDDSLAPLFGIAAGLFGGAYNTSGPPLVIYGTLRRWPARQLRAMLQAYCLIGSIWIVCNHSVYGLLTRKIIVQFSIAAPLIVVATMLGQRATENLPREKFTKWMHVVLLLTASLLLASCTKQTLTGHATEEGHKATITHGNSGSSQFDG